MVLLIILIAAPTISGIVALISVLMGHEGSAPTPNASYKFHVEHTEYPDIADQFDSRITNVFRNPWKGIL